MSFYVRTRTVCQRGYFLRFPIIARIKTSADNEVVPPKTFLDVKLVLSSLGKLGGFWVFLQV